MKSTRREFLKSACRFAVLGALGFAGAKLVKQISFKTGQTCINDYICRGCGVYSGCGLPQALSAKRAIGNG